MRISDWSSDLCSSDLNSERIGGVVDIESKLGQGVRLTLRVPLTLTIIPALTVSVGGHNYAIPRSAIEEIVRSKNNSVKIESVGGARIAGIRATRIPLVSLGDILGVEEGCEMADQSMIRSEEHTSELKSLMRILYAVY